MCAFLTMMFRMSPKRRKPDHASLACRLRDELRARQREGDKQNQEITTLKSALASREHALKAASAAAETLKERAVIAEGLTCESFPFDAEKQQQRVLNISSAASAQPCWHDDATMCSRLEFEGKVGRHPGRLLLRMKRLWRDLETRYEGIKALRQGVDVQVTWQAAARI